MGKRLMSKVIYHILNKLSSLQWGCHNMPQPPASGDLTVIQSLQLWCPCKIHNIPLRQAFDLLISKWGHGSPVWGASLLPIFSLLYPSVLDLGSHTGWDRHTDNGHQCIMPPPYGYNKTQERKNITKCGQNCPNAPEVSEWVIIVIVIIKFL